MIDQQVAACLRWVRRPNPAQADNPDQVVLPAAMEAAMTDPIERLQAGRDTDANRNSPVHVTDPPSRLYGLPAPHHQASSESAVDARMEKRRRDPDARPSRCWPGIRHRSIPCPTVAIEPVTRASEDHFHLDEPVHVRQDRLPFHGTATDRNEDDSPMDRAVEGHRYVLHGGIDPAAGRDAGTPRPRPSRTPRRTLPPVPTAIVACSQDARGPATHVMEMANRSLLQQPRLR